MTFARFLVLLVAAIAMQFGALPMNEALAQDGREETVLEQRAQEVVLLLNGEAQAQDIFGEWFLSEVPPAQFAEFAAQMRAQYGRALAVESLEPRNEFRAALSIRFERAIARGSISLDQADPHKIEGLLFRQFDPINDSAAKIDAELRALPGTVTAYFAPLDGGPAHLSVNPDTQNALGSAMKLYLLAQLGREIASRQRSWDDVVPISTKSFPSGVMQDWPVGAPVTLHTLASQMISISDNTATDILTRLLGQEAILSMVSGSGHADPSINAPWLTTRELFVLKGGPKSRARRYIRADKEARTEILAGIDTPPVSADDVNAVFAKGPFALEIEWFASPRDLAGLFRTMLAECDPQVFTIMSINPSFPAELADQYRYIGYKGGSEPGVLNLTWLLTDKEGRDHILTLGWSNPDAEVDQSRLEALALRILSERG